MIFLFKGSASIQLPTSSSQWDRWLGRKDTMSDVLIRRKVNPLTLAQSWLHLGVLLSDSWLESRVSLLTCHRWTQQAVRFPSEFLFWAQAPLSPLPASSCVQLRFHSGWSLRPSGSRLSHWLLSWCRTSGDFTRDGGWHRTVPKANSSSQ